MRTTQRGLLVQHPHAASHRPEGHEAQSRLAVAQKMARILDYEWLPQYSKDVHQSGRHVYFVPDHTLSLDQAQALGINAETDFFGGAVSYPFMAQKTVARPLVGPHAAAPQGWSQELAVRLSKFGVAGHSAYSKGDAREASLRMLKLGPARIKLGDGVGGCGQFRIDNANDVEAALEQIDEAALAGQGLVVEQNLQPETTYSVGRVSLGAFDIVYCGTQRLTPNNEGHKVYGGSSLVVVRGSFAKLLRQNLPEEMAQAVRLGQQFDAAVAAHMPGFLASRRNYDVIRGQDSSGQWKSGVLEQSWRIGGASPAEIAAMEVFRADQRLRVAHASTVEVYGDQVELPEGAEVYFEGVDENVGRLTKYIEVQHHESLA